MFHSIPIEIFCIILSYLSLDDQIRMRSVDKTSKNIVDKITLRELTISKISQYANFLITYPHTAKYIRGIQTKNHGMITYFIEDDIGFTKLIKEKGNNTMLTDYLKLSGLNRFNKIKYGSEMWPITNGYSTPQKDRESLIEIISKFFPKKIDIKVNDHQFITIKDIITYLCAGVPNILLFWGDFYFLWMYKNKRVSTINYTPNIMARVFRIALAAKNEKLIDYIWQKYYDAIFPCKPATLALWLCVMGKKKDCQDVIDQINNNNVSQVFKNYAKMIGTDLVKNYDPYAVLLMIKDQPYLETALENMIEVFIEDKCLDKILNIDNYFLNKKGGKIIKTMENMLVDRMEDLKKDRDAMAILYKFFWRRNYLAMMRKILDSFDDLEWLISKYESNPEDLFESLIWCDYTNWAISMALEHVYQIDDYRVRERYINKYIEIAEKGGCDYFVDRFFANYSL